jgi:hypothetical protein
MFGWDGGGRRRPPQQKRDPLGGSGSQALMMRRGLLLLLGVLAVVPAAWFLLVAFYFLPRLMTVGQANGITEEAYFPLFHTTYSISLATIGLTLVLGLASLAYLFRSTRVPPEKRSLWAVMLLVGGLFAFPVFWYFYVWRPRAVPA